MEPKLPLMSASFIVTDMKFSPHKCTKYFGIQPTSVTTKGEINLKSKRPMPTSAWRIRTKWARFDSTDTPFQLLLELIWQKRRQIRGFSTKNSLTIQFLLNINGAGKRNFLYEFAPITIARVSYFKAQFRFDVY